MIIVGYQGIGKSTLAVGGNGYIDLESNDMAVLGHRQPDWYIPYCQIANHLSQQGYRVFTSSHSYVREWFRDNSQEEKVIVCPSPRLKEQWTERLRQRWHDTRTDKDFRAYMNAADRYVENIDELMRTDGFDCIVIHSMDYELEDIINSFTDIDAPKVQRHDDDVIDGQISLEL